MFSWHGRLHRLPFLGASLISVVPLLLALGLIYYFYMILAYNAEAIPPIGSDDFLLFLLQLLEEDMTPFYLAFPLTYVSIVLGAKRLRSMGLPPAISAVVNVANYFAPIEGPIATMMSLLVFGYYVCLLVAPPAETGTAAAESGAAQPGSAGTSNYGFQGIPQPGSAGGNSYGPQGAPRRHPRIRDWRVIAPAPRRDGK